MQAVAGTGLRRMIGAVTRQPLPCDLDDLTTGTIAPQGGVAFMAALSAYGRIRDHCQNVAEAVSREK